MNGLPLFDSSFEISLVEENGAIHTYKAESFRAYADDGSDYITIHYGIKPLYTVVGSGRYSSIDDIVI